MNEKLKFFIKVVNENQEEKKDMFVYLEQRDISKDKFLYYSDKNNILHKINILNGREIWNYNAGNDIKSIAIDHNKHIFILTADGTLEIDSDSNDISAYTNLKGNEMIIDSNMYLAKGNKVSKLDSNYKEVANYTVNGDITNLTSDSKGNIYIGTSSEIIKVKNDFVSQLWKYKVDGNEKLGENLLPPFSQQYVWTEINGGTTWYNNSSNILISKKGDNNSFITLDGSDSNYIKSNPNTKYRISWRYNKGNKIGLYFKFCKDHVGNKIGGTKDMVITENSYTFTTPKDCNMYCVYFERIDTEYELSDVKLQEIQGGGTYSLATNGDNLYIATKEEIQVLDGGGNMIDGLNITNTNAIAVDKENMYLGQGNDLNEYVRESKKWTSKNNSEITNIVLE